MTHGRRTAPLAALATVATVAAALAAGGPATGQAGAPLLTVGIDVANATRSSATYRIVVTNHGTGPATGVELTAPVPTNTTFASAVPAATTACADGGTPEPAATACEWTLPDLPAGQAAIVETTLGLAQANTTYTVTQNATATAAGGQSTTDSDATLVRAVLTDLKATHVDDLAAPGTRQDSCPQLRVTHGSSTAFVRHATEHWESVTFPQLERVWASELRAFVTTPTGQAPGATQLAAHRVDTPWRTKTGDPDACSPPQTPGVIETATLAFEDTTDMPRPWEGTDAQQPIEGTFGFEGDANPTPSDVPRTGWKPASAATPTVVADYTSAPAGAWVSWDVSADVDTAAERSTNYGWEIVDRGEGETFTTLLASENATANKPQMVVVHVVKEPATCVDADPESAAWGSRQEALLTVQATDGARVSGAGGDGCSGGPYDNGRVHWTIEDDDPDISISRLDGRELSAASNLGVSALDPDGRAVIGIRMAEPSGGDAGGDAGASRIAAALPGAPDPESCTVSPCPAESNAEDDALLAWTWDAAPAPPPSGDDDDDTPAGDGGAAQQPGTGQTAPTGGGAVAGQTAAGRSIALDPVGRAVFGRPLAIGGRLTSPANDCRAGQRVELQAREAGTWQSLARATTAADGTFRVAPLAGRRADYRVLAPATARCAAASSDSATVMPAAAVSLAALDLSVRRGALVRLTGRVAPALAGTRVVLERRVGRRWITVARAQLDRRSARTFAVRARRGTNTFRLRSPQPSGGVGAGVSRPVTVSGR